MKTLKNDNVKKDGKKTLNIVLTVVQVVLIIFCLGISIFIINNPGGYRKEAKDCNTNVMVVMSDSMTPTIGENAIIFGSKTSSAGSYHDDKLDLDILDLGTVVTFAAKALNGYYLNTHRIVGYQYYYQTSDKSSFGESKLYYKKGYVEDFSDFNEFASSFDGTIKFLGYVTRGDKYTISNFASTDDCAIYMMERTTDKYGNNIPKLDEAGNPIYVLDENNNRIIDYSLDDSNYREYEDILAVWTGRKIEGVGKVMKWLQKPLHFGLCILLPLVLLFIYNIFLVVKMIIADKSEKAKKAALEELKKNDIDEEEIKRKAVEEYLASLKKNENNEEKKAE